MVREERVTALDLPRVADRYLDLHPSASCPSAIATLAGLTVRLDEEYCRKVADHFDRAPRSDEDPALLRSYDRMARESRQQYLAIRDAGVEIRPWLGPGQPYRDSAELISRFGATGTLYVYLTRSGHGPGPARSRHPLRARSGIVVDGVAFTHNDVFRAVHDVFGHVMFGHGFGPRGELKATYCHMHMYSEEAHPALFAEQIGQVSWFFFGPHLRDPDGTVPAEGERGYLPPRERPYAEQKVISFDRWYLSEFRRMFDVRPSSRSRDDTDDTAASAFSLAEVGLPDPGRK